MASVGRQIQVIHFEAHRNSLIYPISIQAKSITVPPPCSFCIEQERTRK